MRQGTTIPIYRVQKSVMIQKATSKDAQTIAYFLFMAMEEIVYQFIGKKDKEMALKFLNHLPLNRTINTRGKIALSGKLTTK